MRRSCYISLLLLLLTSCPEYALAVTGGTRNAAGPGGGRPAVLRVNAQPLPAHVFLDSIDLGPAPVEIPQGDTLTHQIRVEAPWYRQWRMPAKFDPRNDREINATLRHQEGTLIIATKPAGATVRINGKMAGYAPQTLANQSAGPCQVSVELAGYRPASTDITVNDGQIAAWNPVLQARLAQISFTGWPARATITCRQQELGTVPMVWEDIKPGSYAFEVKRPGFEPGKVRCTAYPDSTTMVAVRLRPTRALNAMLRSMLVPGSGQIYRGYEVKGLLLKGAWFVSLAALAVAYNDRSDRYQTLNDATTSYQTTIKDYDLNYQRMTAAYSAAVNSNRRLNIILAAISVVYLSNLIDAALFAPNDNEFKGPGGVNAAP